MLQYVREAATVVPLFGGKQQDQPQSFNLTDSIRSDFKAWQNYLAQGHAVSKDVQEISGRYEKNLTSHLLGKYQAILDGNGPTGHTAKWSDRFKQYEAALAQDSNMLDAGQAAALGDMLNEAQDTYNPGFLTTLRESATGQIAAGVATLAVSLGVVGSAGLPSTATAASADPEANGRIDSSFASEVSQYCGTDNITQASKNACVRAYHTEIESLDPEADSARIDILVQRMDRYLSQTGELQVQNSIQMNCEAEPGRTAEEDILNNVRVGISGVVASQTGLSIRVDYGPNTDTQRLTIPIQGSGLVTTDISGLVDQTNPGASIFSEHFEVSLMDNGERKASYVHQVNGQVRHFDPYNRMGSCGEQILAESRGVIDRDAYQRANTAPTIDDTVFEVDVTNLPLKFSTPITDPDALDNFRYDQDDSTPSYIAADIIGSGINRSIEFTVANEVPVGVRQISFAAQIDDGNATGGAYMTFNFNNNIVPVASPGREFEDSYTWQPPRTVVADDFGGTIGYSSPSVANVQSNPEFVQQSVSPLGRGSIFDELRKARADEFGGSIGYTRDGNIMQPSAATSGAAATGAADAGIAQGLAGRVRDIRPFNGGFTPISWARTAAKGIFVDAPRIVFKEGLYERGMKPVGRGIRNVLDR